MKNIQRLVLLALTLSALSLFTPRSAQAQTTFPLLGETAQVEGPAAGMDSVVLAVASPTNTWTALANTSWLHLPATNGSGSTNVVFSYDTNSGPTRVGSLIIAGQTLTVTQAGAPYVQAPGPVTALDSSGLVGPVAIAVDGSGNVYFAGDFNNTVQKWMVANNTISTLVSSNLSSPAGLAVDRSGNLYIADIGDNTVKEWLASSGMLITLVSSKAGLNEPMGLAVDGSGNVYIADYSDNAIKEWSVTNGNLTTLVSSGLDGPVAVAVDAAGNVYSTDIGSLSVQKWTAANGAVTTLFSSDLNQPGGIAVDGAGNVYVADYANIAIEKWTAASNVVTALTAPQLSGPFAIAVDGSHNLYIADFGGDTTMEAIWEMPYAYVDAAASTEPALAGSDVLPAVLPSTANLQAPFAPVSGAPWLAVTGASNGVVSFSFSENFSGAGRAANISLLGQSIQVTQTVAGASGLVWPTPAPITYGTALGPNQLNATEKFAGSFSYNPPAGSILPAGTQILSAFFTLGDSGSPNATGTVALVVLPATLTVTASNATRTFGQTNPPFSGSISGLASGDNISATYSCSANTSSPVGAYSIVPFLVDPNKRLANYNTAIEDGTLTITSQWLVITSQPLSQEVDSGSTANLSVGVAGTPPFYYQWSRDARIVPGYETPVCCQGTLTLTNVDSTFDGIYQVVVSNDYGSVTSAPAALSVVDSTAYPLGIALQGTNAVLSWPQTGADYVLQSSSALNPPNWTTFPMPSVQTGGNNQVTVPVGTIPVFFRIKKSYNWDDSGLGVNWTDNGPSLCGRLVGIVASPINPNTLLVSSAGGGVWRSTDGGATWNMPGDYALGDFTVVHLEWDRIRSGRLFASTYSDLYATTDLGDNWDNLTHFGGYPAPGWANGPALPTVPEPFAQLRYSATQSTVFWSKPGLGLYYSYDGSTFTQTWPFPGGSANPDNSIISIGADDATGYVYFSTAAENLGGPPHLFRSANPWTTTIPCLNWISVNSTLPPGNSLSFVCSIAYGGTANSMAVLLATSQNPEVCTTTTSGMAWNPTPKQPPGTMWDPRALFWPAPNQFIFSADVAQGTTDGGNTWNQVYFSPMHPDTRAFYAGSYPNGAGNFLWITTDGTGPGGNYTAIGQWDFTPGSAPTDGTTVSANGISTWQIYYMESTGVSGGSHRRIFMGAQDNGALVSDDNGTTWTIPGTPPGGGCGDYFSLVFAPNDPDRAYSRNCADTFERSDNAYSAATAADVTWTSLAMPPGLQNPSIVTEGETAVDPNNANHVCFAMFNSIAVSTTGGTSWTVKTLPGGDQLVCVYYDNSGNLYAGTIGAGAFVSADDGNTWTPFGLNSSPPTAVMRIAHSTAGGGVGTFFLATTSGLYRLLPGGTWTLQTADPSYVVSDVQIDPANPMRVCIAMGYANGYNQHRGGVLLSTDDGTTFTSLTAGMSIHQAPIAAVQFDPVDSSIHAAVFGLGGWTYQAP